MPNKFYSIPKSVFEHYHAKLKDWVRAVLPTKTSDLTNDSDFLDQLALAGIVASNFSTSSTYAVGDYVLYNHTLYRCKTAISTAGAWDSSKWDATKTQDIFQGSAPGLVPAAESGDADKVLKGDGTWGDAGSSVRISYDAQTEELHMDFSPLPVEFLDYLELSTGRVLFDLTQSQWSQSVSSSNKIILDTELTNTTSYTSCILGFKYTSGSTFDLRYYLNSIGLNVEYNYGSTNTIFYRISTSYYNKRMIISYDKGAFKFDDQSANIPYSLGDLNQYSIGYSLSVGGMNTNLKVYGYKVIDENENEVINAVPAKRKLDNVIGMYDLVTNTFVPVSSQS